MVETPHIVKDFFIGNTRIKIADNCCRDKTVDDVEKILCKMEEIARIHFNLIVEAKNHIE